MLMFSIHEGNCLDILKCMESDSVDFIITSPPYADLRNYRISEGESFSGIKPNDYVDWFLPIAKELYRVLKPTGSFILNINDKVVNTFQHLYVFELLIKLCKEVNFHLVRDYIWFNTATAPKRVSGRTKKSHEYCFWFAKGIDWTFNIDAIRKPYSKSMDKYFKAIGKKEVHPSGLTFDKSKVWKDHGGSDPGDVILAENLEEFFNDYIDFCNHEPGDVLAMGNGGCSKSLSAMKIKHPARFPEKLVEFFIKAGTNENDVVLDPFMGSGTVAVVAERLNRKWIGIELSKDYIESAYMRIEQDRKERKLGENVK